MIMERSRNRTNPINTSKKRTPSIRNHYKTRGTAWNCLKRKTRSKRKMHKRYTYFPLRPCVNHFSHNHPLRPIDQIREQDELVCSGCGLQVVGSTFICTKSDCNFLLHKSCFELNSLLQHQSHPRHLLQLLPVPPRDDHGARLFVCDACDDYGTGFDYHCSVCEFDLHVGCARLPKTIKHVDHRHLLTLYYSFSCINRDIVSFVCDVCGQHVENKLWVYYCDECDFGIHLRCTIPDCTDPLS